ncbi:MAG: T9SS type A sorting domain-containing protein [Ignavibacteriales bacterium]|nr:T9SS type A sorting domain-containing protein [Ignavibacteriales bacterium]
MKPFMNVSILAAAILSVVSTAVSQVTSLTINGASSNVSFVSGASISWEIHLPIGGTSQNEFWLDVNQNNQIDPGTDRQLFVFTQTDGQSGANDPGDMDNTANGVISFSAPNVGFAPAKWLFSAKNNNVGLTVAFTVTPLQNPAANISGTVSGPQGAPKQYLVMEAKEQNSGDQSPFWHGITDASGNYSIAVGGNPVIGSSWRVGMATDNASVDGYIATPMRQSFPLAVSVTGINFMLIQGTVITGRVTNGATGIANAGVSTHDPLNPYTNDDNQFHANTDTNGYYAMTVPPGKYFIHFGAYHYFDKWWNNKTSNYDTVIVVNLDTIKNIDAALQLSGVIQGRVTNWGIPVRAMVQLKNSTNQNQGSTNTQNDGSYNFSVAPGTYYVQFSYGGDTLNYDNTNSNPGTSIVISGTEIHDHIDANFQVGLPPAPPAPKILAIIDVPNDQGKKVFVRWKFNEPQVHVAMLGVFGIEKYTIWRREAQGWTFAGAVPSRNDSIYTAIVPTLWDSTIVSGMRWSKFQVSAHYWFNLYVLSSPIDSGYSIDNLAPGVPSGVGGSIAGSNLTLKWKPMPDEDFQYFAIYRSTTKNFGIAGLKPYAQTSDTSFTDVGAVSSVIYYYKVTALDFSGNEGLPSTEISSVLTGVAEEPILPKEYALHQNYPNPFNPTTTLMFDVPHEAFVTLKVFNVLGQEVRSLVNEQKSAGRYTVNFDAKDLASGLYIYKFTAGSFSAIKKMNLIK